MNTVYARVGDVKTDGNAAASSSNDDGWLRLLVAASDEVRSLTGREFAAKVDTRYIDVPTPHSTNDYGLRLHLPWDVVSITTLSLFTANPLTFGTVLAENTDFIAVHEDDDTAKPIVALDALPGSSLLSQWPAGTRQVKLAGVLGYSYETEDTGLVGTLDSDSDTSLTLTATGQNILYAGETIRMGDEQLYVSAVAGTAVTVERGVNGTTAAAHSNVSVLRRRYPRKVDQATRLRAMDLYAGQKSAQQFDPRVEGAGGFTSSTAYRQFLGLLAPPIRKVRL